MYSARVKKGFFVLEGLNSLAIVYYTYYLYFFLSDTFGFGDRANLLVAALSGLVYMFAAWWGGNFSQKFGYFLSLKIGFLVMAGSLLIGANCSNVTVQILVLCSVVFGMCFTWPTLEAVVSEGEHGLTLQKNIGTYNIVWAGTGAIGFFIGGGVFDRFGSRSIFYFPAAIQIIQLFLTCRLQKVSRIDRQPAPMSVNEPDRQVPATASVSALRDKSFLRMAWLANPFAYIAINTLIAFIPGVALKFHWSTARAGNWCSVWCFARLASFVILYFWSGWHYRFNWLFGAFAAMIISFAIVCLSHTLLALVAAQILLGFALGLIYSSSLFYSMDGSETKGEHGGIHEAAIGFGNFAGPAVGAASLYLFSASQTSGAWAVTGVLCAGLAGVLGIRLAFGRQTRRPSS